MAEDIKLIQHPSVKVIRRSEEFVVDGLGKVTRMTAIDAGVATLAKEPLALFQGYAILGTHVGGQIRPFPVEWLIEGVSTVEEAFDVFQKQAVDELKQNMEQAAKQADAERKRIITAPAQAVKGLKIP